MTPNDERNPNYKFRIAQIANPESGLFESARRRYFPDVSSNLAFSSSVKLSTPRFEIFSRIASISNVSRRCFGIVLPLHFHLFGPPTNADTGKNIGFIQR